MWENHNSCVETNLKLSETAALAVETKCALMYQVKWTILKVDYIFFKKTCKYLEIFVLPSLHM